MQDINKFPKFYLNTNTTSCWIRNTEDLETNLDTLFEKNVSLFKIRAKNSLDRLEFGTGFDYTSTTTLFEFLDANDIDITRWLKAKRFA